MSEPGIMESISTDARQLFQLISFLIVTLSHLKFTAVNKPCVSWVRHQQAEESNDFRVTLASGFSLISVTSVRSLTFFSYVSETTFRIFLD